MALPAAPGRTGGGGDSDLPARKAGAARSGARIVIGTAGHVDHGKTALVRALTGIDTDRLEEEKRRGITIELGFAHLALKVPAEGPAAGTVAGVIDVPGHERFVKAMAAGVGGVDLVVLVVAADEGVMPQTREHVDICELLGLKRGVIAVTKSDLLPDLGAEWASLLRVDLAGLVAGTFLEAAPVVEVSAKTGRGLDDLVRTLSVLAAELPKRPVAGPAYLPIDRAFTLKGFGTIVTGTLLSGSLASGQEVDLLPDGPRAVRLRSLQTHGEETAEAWAGQRTAANLTAVEAAEVKRGMVVCAAGALEATSLLDVELLNLRSSERPLRARQKLLCHLGTAVVPCTAVLLGQEGLPVGARAFAQLRLAQPLVALPGQRFILRGFAQRGNRGRTAAGGIVLAVAPRKRSPRRPGAADGLAVLRDGTPTDRIAWLLEDAGASGLTEAALVRLTALPGRVVAAELSLLGSQGRALLFDRSRRAYVGARCFNDLGVRASRLVTEFHRARPLLPGMPKEELRQRLAPSLDAHLFQRLLGKLEAESQAVAEGETVRLTGHASAARSTDTEARAKIAAVLEVAGLCPPTLSELARGVALSIGNVAALLKLLIAEGAAVKVSEDLYFSAAAIDELRGRLVTFLKVHGEIATPEFKALTGATRKFTIPLGELFDREKLTLRLGDKRVLRGGGEARQDQRGANRSDASASGLRPSAGKAGVLR
jgi:selenocysteine-specific elongation factor